MAKQLLEPVLDHGIPNANFVNNRILTAEDLQTEQAANRQQHRQLGVAIGEGVVEGLEVSVLNSGAGGVPPILAIGKGLALNRAGQAVALPDDTQLALAADPPAATANAGLFADCDTPETTAKALTGVFVLTISPASGYQGLAPVQNLIPSSKIPGCVNRFKVEGVTFRLLSLPLSPALAKDLGDVNTLRNRLAHLCFGTEDLQAFPTDPFHFPTTYGALDLLRQSDPSRPDLLTDCDVPLALLHWTSTGIQFCDVWAARRQPTAPLPNPMWPLHVGQRRIIEAEATFLQFQAHLAYIQQKETNLGSLTAASRFRYLPAGGYLPLGTGGFDRDTFFSGIPLTKLPFNPAAQRNLIAQSFLLESIDLSAPPPLAIYENAAGYLIFLRADSWQPLTLGSLEVSLNFFLPNVLMPDINIFTLTVTNSAGGFSRAPAGPGL